MPVWACADAVEERVCGPQEAPCSAEANRLHRPLCRLLNDYSLSQLNPEG